MKQAFAGLFASRKFVVMCLVVIVVAGLVAAGKIPVSDFTTTVQNLGMLLIAAIGAEGVAEKWNLPPGDSK